MTSDVLANFVGLDTFRLVELWKFTVGMTELNNYGHKLIAFSHKAA